MEINHGNGGKHKQTYDFNPLTGNLNFKHFHNYVSNTNLKEYFTFDDLDRLTQLNQVDPQYMSIIQQNNIAIGILGNITHKDDAGDLQYNVPNKPFVLGQVTNATNNISLNTLSVLYNDLDKVKQLSEMGSNKQMDLMYGTNDERIKVDYSVGGSNQYTRYYGENYDRQETLSGYKEWTYIFAPSGLCATYYNNNGTPQLNYVLNDHLGSPVLLTDQGQNMVEEYSFDAWGRRRNPTDWSYNNVSASTKMIRGYTGHEQLDEVGMINMNGRIYDPVLGRFVQPDPVVQDAGNVQNMNRYSYCLNNPVNLTDPSGYRFIAPRSGVSEGPNSSGTRISRPVVYYDGIRIEPGSGDYNFLGGGGANGGSIAIKQNFGVWTGNGPGLKDVMISRGAMLDFANANPKSVTGMNGSGAWIKFIQGDNGTLMNSITGQIYQGIKNGVNVSEKWVEFGNGAQSGGGIDPFGVALGIGELAHQGSVYNSFGRSAEGMDNLLKNGKYLHNGEVYYQGNYKGVTNAMKSSLSSAKLARNIGRGFAYVGAATALYDFANSNQTGADYARLTGAALITASAFIPVVGPFISIGLGIADSFGAFDDFYNSKR